MLKQKRRNSQASTIFLCLWFLVGGLLLPAKMLAGEVEEYAVKAGFVLNFAKAVQWPDATFQGSPETFHLCIVGNDSLVDAFKVAEGKRIGERTIQVFRITTASDYDRCHVLFIGQDIDRASLLRLFTAVKDRPVLIIGETQEFARIGGIINFVNKDGKLHFEINPHEAERHGLKISSRILQLATIVEND